MRLTNASLPDRPGRHDVTIEGTLIAAVAPHDPGRHGDGRDLEGRMIWPTAVDLHTHLDRAFTGPRQPQPALSIADAQKAIRRDREGWTRADLATRMEFAVASAYAHGTAAIRTNLDSSGRFARLSWPVFGELKARWAGRVELEAACLVATSEYLAPGSIELCRLVQEHDGLLGGVAAMSPDLDAELDRLFELAGRLGTGVELQVDETGDPKSHVLDRVARAVTRTGFSGQVVCAHCCSLSTQPEAMALSTLDSVAGAGITLVCLPMGNLHLQDRIPGRTPRWRGITLVHEARARGIDVVFASDGVRDPFHPYGDLDPVELFREAVRIAQLDQPLHAWLPSIMAVPAALMGRPAAIEPRAEADLIILEGRSFGEVLSRPQLRRQVVRKGRILDVAPPSYELLDELPGPQ